MDWFEIDKDDRPIIWEKIEILVNSLLEALIIDAKEKAELAKQRGK